ncbi:MAG: HPP family protein [Myxococcota bacterium]
MEARDVMSADFLVASPDQPLEVAHRLMLDHVVHHLPVVLGGRLVGVLSDRDVLLAVGHVGSGDFVYPPLAVKDVMSAPAAVAHPGDGIAELARRMIDAKFSALPIVTERDELIGLVTSTDLLRFVSSLPHADAPRLSERTLAAVRELVRDGGFQSAARRLGEFRKTLEQQLDTEGRLVPIFIDRTGDPRGVAQRLRDAHQQIARRLDAAAAAISRWEAERAFAALDALAEALRVHRATEADLLRSPAMEDLISRRVDWERLRFQLTHELPS